MAQKQIKSFGNKRRKIGVYFDMDEVEEIEKFFREHKHMIQINWCTKFNRKCVNAGLYVTNCIDCKEVGNAGSE